MPFEIVLLVKFPEDAELKDRYNGFEELLAVPRPVTKGEPVAKELGPGEHAKRYKNKPVIDSQVKLKNIAGPNLSAVLEKGTGLGALVSRSDGHLCVKNGFLTVTKTVEITGDVGSRTGNLSFDGPVLVHGGVESGYSVTSGADLEVLGLVENASVKAGGDILLKGGMAGGGEGLAQAGKNLYASFVQQGNLEATGSIIMKGLSMDSHLSAGQKIIFEGRSSLVGGEARAREEVSVAVVGSAGAVPTTIRLGVNPFAARVVENKSDKVGSIRKSIGDRLKDAQYAASHLDPPMKLHPKDFMSDLFHVTQMANEGAMERMNPETEEMFHKLGSTLLQIITLVEDLGGVNKKDSSAPDTPCARATLKVGKVAHPGVVVVILGKVYNLEKEYVRARFVLNEDTIEALPL